MQLFVTCDCTHTTPVTSASCGETIQCVCGKHLIVPSLSELKRSSQSLQTPVVQANVPNGKHADRPSSHRIPAVPMGKTLDSLVSSDNGYKILAGTTIGTPILTAFCIARGLRRRGDDVSPVVFGVAIAVATAFGFLIGLVVVAQKRFKLMRTNGTKIPWLYRVMFEGSQ